MEREKLRRLLESVRTGSVDPDTALSRIRDAPIRELGYATLDLQRALRRGFPEVIYGGSKSVDQVVGIARELHGAGQTVLVTRVGDDVHAAVKQELPTAEYHPAARAITVRTSDTPEPTTPGILVVTAGTSDLPVAAEATLTAELLGNAVDRVEDVGIAGLHRLFERREQLARARVIVVVAGMDGALPAVVAGLTDCPVIGVPTSTGYGAGGQGEAALLTMLNSCAAGLTVVNIDNGFGAGLAAGMILRSR